MNKILSSEGSVYDILHWLPVGALVSAKGKTVIVMVFSGS